MDWARVGRGFVQGAFGGVGYSWIAGHPNAKMVRMKELDKQRRMDRDSQSGRLLLLMNNEYNV